MSIRTEVEDRVLRVPLGYNGKTTFRLPKEYCEHAVESIGATGLLMCDVNRYKESSPIVVMSETDWQKISDNLQLCLDGYKIDPEKYPFGKDGYSLEGVVITEKLYGNSYDLELQKNGNIRLGQNASILKNPALHRNPVFIWPTNTTQAYITEQSSADEVSTCIGDDPQSYYEKLIGSWLRPFDLTGNPSESDIEALGISRGPFFLGSYSTRVDDKGRMGMPSNYK